MNILKMSCTEAVKSGEAVESGEADEGLPVDSDAVQLLETQAACWGSRLFSLEGC